MPNFDIGAYDIFLEYNGEKIGFILGKGEGGAVNYWPGLAPTLAQQINTGAFSYEQIPSEIDVPVPSERWQTCGVTDSETTPLESYHYSQHIDASHGTRLYLSPERQAVVEDDESAIAAAPVKFLDSTLGFFIIAGAYIYEYNSGQWTERDDASGDGENYTDIVEMDGVLYACRGQGADYKYSTNGTSWNAFTDTDNNFDRFTVRGVSSGEAVLWGIKADGTIKNTTNGANSGVAWSSGDALGHTSEVLGGAVTANDDIYVTKDSGIYRYTGSATEDVWLGGNQMKRSTNGSYPYVWYDLKVYVPYGDRLLAFDPAATDSVELDFVFPSRAMGSSSELNGQITAIDGNSEWLFVALKNSAGNTYILKGNPYKNAGLGEWHTFLYLGANDCNALKVVGPGVIAANNPSLVIGYGTAASYYILERQGLKPEDDANYRFDTTIEAKLVGSWKSIGAQAFNKFLNAGRIVSENTSTARKISLKYEVDSALGTESNIVTATSAGSTAANIETVVEFNRIRTIIAMETGANTSGPVGVGFIFNTTPNPPRKRTWSFEVVVGDLLEANGGVRSRYVGKDLEEFLFSGLTERVTFYDRRGRTFTVKILDLRTVQTAPTEPGGDTEAVRINQGEVGVA